MNIFKKSNAHSLIKISRFPHFWIWSSGFFLWGGLMSDNTIFTPIYIFIFIWFMLPGNIYMNALNDAHDYETDINNPRKKEIESVCLPEKKSEMLKIGYLSLLSILIFVPFLSIKTIILFCIWSASIYLYNTPPFRFKSKPIADFIFGGVGHFVPIITIGYSIQTNTYLHINYIIWASLFTAAGIIFSNAIDYEYDKTAGIKNTDIYLGSQNKSFILAFVIYVFFILFGLYIGLTLESLVATIFLLLFPLYFVKKIKHDEILYFNIFTIINIIFGCSIGLLFVIE